MLGLNKSQISGVVEYATQLLVSYGILWRLKVSNIDKASTNVDRTSLARLLSYKQEIKWK